MKNKRLFLCISLVLFLSPVTVYSGWSPMTSGTTTQLNGIWGSSGSDVFAVGNNGTILHYDGSIWSSMTSGTIQTFRGIWGSSESDVFAVGGTTILHYSGPPLSTWSSSSIPTGCQQVHTGPIVYLCPSVNAIWGSSPTDVFAVGDYSAWLEKG